ncbi:hypothetical protein N7474_003304 [Penicillium riverlandense]|uniref:uncharacterized protein n=1 Tax=Penicillium riverlandense TaxID=1903569 RepID=UPI0025485F16|nr:uncharacterized protein N7474_003304 [Penicillium riverlandense]KAJ5826166.1 hypothetical protein N7474_003304 [Penicillium riverlandense]
MDGDNHGLKHHDRLRGIGHSSSARLAAMHNNSRAVDSSALSAAERVQQMPYADYTGHTGTAFQAGSLQANEVPGTYQQDFARHQHQQPQHHHRQQQQQQQRRGHLQQQHQDVQHQQQASLNPYESAMLYGFQGPSTHSQGAYEVVPQYSARQSAATMDALSNQFGVPQYYVPEEPSSAGVVPQSVLSPYLSAQLQQQPYSTNPQAASIARPSTTGQQQPFAATMADFTSIGAAPTARIDPHQHHQQQQLSADPSLDEAYRQYQRALLLTFEHTRAGRLVEASRSLLEISEWLVTNARDLGILRDDHLLYADRLQLWSDFNLCWLAVCQKQKDLTHDLVATGHPPPQTSLLRRERLEAMGKVLIHLCDQLEQHGLVDYQVGVWEEEILCVLGQCLDLIEARPDLLRLQPVPEPAAAKP